MPSKFDSVEAIRRWDLHARQFVSHLDPIDAEPHRIVLLDPALFQLLRDVAGKRVLDKEAMAADGIDLEKYYRPGGGYRRLDVREVKG
jgi:hypothetical protein